MLQANFIVTPQTGTALSTKFTTTNLTSGGSVDEYIWDFGTKSLIYDEINPTFTYNYPGTYNISLTAIDYNSNASYYSQQVTVDFAYRDYIRFTHIPDRFSDPGRLTDTPFKFEVISSQPDKPLVVDLFAANSPSTPYQFVPEKWNFLTPTWKFLDKNLTPTASLSVIPVPVYKDGTIVAVSGVGEFYFVDSLSVGDPIKNCPLLLTVTLQTSGFNYPHDSYIYPYESYANNQSVRAGVVWHVNDLLPTTLKITGNYLEDIQTKQWEGVKIPILITAHADRSHILPGSESKLSEILFSYPITNTIGKQGPVELTFSDLTLNDCTIDEAPLYFQTTDSNNQDSRGYIFTTVTGLTTIPATSIVAHTTAFLTLQNTTTNNFLYPGAYAPNISVWVSNPEKNTLNKITLIPDSGNCNTINYFKQQGVLTDGIIQEVQVPATSSASTFNYEMSGFSGIYGVAIDPRNYDLIAADAELDRLYRFSNTGELLKTFELSSLNDYNANRKMFDFWTWKTKNPEEFSTKFTFYKPTYYSSQNTNYILQAGGAILPSSYLQINSSNNTVEISLSALLFEPFAENINIDLIQIFNPNLPTKYASSVMHWTSASPVSATTFNITNITSLSTNPNYYIVSVDGIVQRPDCYTINNTNKTLNFTTPVIPNTVVNLIYIPSVLPPTNWTQTFTSYTTAFLLTGSLNQQNYKPDPYSSFLVNIGGVLQNPEIYTFNVQKQQLEFKESLPLNTQISVTQLTVPENVNIPAAYTPAYVSLDKNYNIWVSLFNSVSVLKFDPDFNLLFSAAPTIVNWPNISQTTSPSFNYLAELENESLLKPPVAETDQNNNCWVTYANPLCSLLVKYSESGSPDLQIPLELYSIPTNLAINVENNVWVCNSFGSSYEQASLPGKIQLYNTNTGQLINSLTNINRPNNLALDRNNNIWFTHSLRQIGFYNTTTNLLSSWVIDRSGNFTIQPILSSYELENEHDDELGGLAVDVFDRVWILDSTRNFAYVLSATPNFEPIFIRSFKIVPDITVGYYIDLNTGSTYTKEGDYYYRSAQATGDWTGNRWYQKYATLDSLTTREISGTSGNFSITPFVNKNQIRRINETFNTAEYYRTLALPEALNVNSILFNKFFPATVGTGYLSANEDPGQTVYEKIANFVINHSDIDTCNIDQLLSLAEHVAVPALDYAATYPTQIRNMLDISSIARGRLWGIEDKAPILTQSLGSQYDVLTDTLTAGTSIILKSRFDSSLSLLQVPPLSTGELTYSLFDFRGFGLIEPVTVNYIFYRFKPAYTGNYLENIIDWESPFTTLTPTASTFEDWYGPGGAIETAFRYILTENLFPK